MKAYEATLLALSGDTSVMVEDLLECNELVSAIASDTAYDELLNIVNNNF